MKLKYIICGFIVFALLAGCAKPPIAEMDSAKEAVFKAENDPNAVLYGSGSLSRAKDSLRRMQTEADSKRYDAAKTHAAEAVAAAERAIADGKTGLARVKNEAESLISGLGPVIEETERNINEANYNKLNLDFKQIRSDLEDAKDTFGQAEYALKMERYQNALDKGYSVRSALGSINLQIASATPRKKS